MSQKTGKELGWLNTVNDFYEEFDHQRTHAGSFRQQWLVTPRTLGCSYWEINIRSERVIEYTRVKRGCSLHSTGGLISNCSNRLATIQLQDGTNQCTKEYGTFQFNLKEDRLTFVTGNISYDTATCFQTGQAKQGTNISRFLAQRWFN
jgi:hypothetical protein